MESRAKVLIIEDNTDLLNILEQLLGADYDVATARRGEDGVRLATSLRPDLIIMDLQLPKMSGIEAGLWIKREIGPVPILVLSAVTEPDAVLQSGCCDAFMAKPAPIDAIRAKVAELLASHPGVWG
jgi:DNA-binding response OmpR family regulator